jgi:hypothetical protein
MAKTRKGNSVRVDGYQPCPECNRGHSFWEDICEKCSECGREFDANGLIVGMAHSEGDLDGWGNLS